METGWQTAGAASCGFPKFVPRTNKLAAQCVAERHAAFRSAPQQIGGAAYRRERRGFPVCTRTNRWCSPATSDSQKEALKEICHQMKPRKEEEPSSTAAHSPIRTPHRTPHIQNVFDARAKFISAPMRPARRRIPPTPFHGHGRRLPQSQCLLTLQRPVPSAGARSTTAARLLPAAVGPKPVALRAHPTRLVQPAFSSPLAEPVLFPTLR